MSNYYDKRDLAVIIAEALMARDWNVYGYKPNESDMMYDYYSPADWAGVAEKNGWVLVFNNKATMRENEVEDWRLTEKAEGKKIYFPAHEANPKGTSWHIEKNGEIYETGRAMMNMHSANIYYRINRSTLKPKCELDEDDKKALKNLVSFIEKIEKIAAVKTGEEGQEEKLEKVIKKVEKIEKKLVEIENPTEVKIGDVFWSNSHYVQVIEISENLITVVKLGSKQGGFKQSKSASAIENWRRKGAYGIETAILNGGKKLYKIEEEKVVEEKITYKKVKATKKVKVAKNEMKQEEKGEMKQEEKVEMKQEEKTEEKTEETPTHSNTQQHEEKAEEKQGLAQVIEEIEKINDENIQKELIGEWLWISGDTWKHKETLKKLGFRWASKKKMWYYREEEKTPKWRSKKEYSMDEIKNRYTTKTL